jgi:chorismate mutase/prephenate dehydratase
MLTTRTSTLYEAQIQVAQSVLATIPGESFVTLGPAGSNSHLVALDLLETVDDESTDIILCDSFDEVVDRVHSGIDLVGIMPVTNTIGGNVFHGPDALLTNSEAIQRAGHRILAAVGLPVEHCLLGQSAEAMDVDGGLVYSNPQALRQCARYIGERSLTAVDTQSTSAAAQALANAELPANSVVIAPPLAGEVYDLAIIDEGIGDKVAEDNITTMALFSRHNGLIPAQMLAG